MHFNNILLPVRVSPAESLVSQEETRALSWPVGQQNIRIEFPPKEQEQEVPTKEEVLYERIYSTLINRHFRY